MMASARTKRIFHFSLALAAGAALLMIAAGLLQARSQPVVRRLDLPVAQAMRDPISILFISDFHVHGPDMPPSRLRSIVLNLNALRPDLIVLGGDFRSTIWLGSRYSVRDAIAPLRLLKAKYGIVAVLGNHDCPDKAAVKEELARAGIRVLVDQAQVFGPVSVGGIDRRRKYTALRLSKLPEPRILVAHNPQHLLLVRTNADLLLAGHTHCGQIAVPLLGPISTGGRVPRAHACGLSKVHGVPLIVTSGLGTSTIPLRLEARPDVWLIKLHGPGQTTF